MAITNHDQLLASFSAGKRSRYDWNKITGAAAYTAGRWYSMLSLAGSPVATTFPGTAKTFVNCDDANGDGTNKFGMWHGGNVSTDIKHLISRFAMTSAGTGVPSVLRLVDVVGYWPGIDMNVNTSQALSGTPTLTRWPDGKGLQLFLEARSTAGSTGHNLSYTYTNQDGTGSRTNPVTVACTASAIVPHITHSGVAANNYGPFLPLASGDYGVRNVASVQLSAASGSASTAALVLCRPLADIALGVALLGHEKDLINQIASMPTIPDGACLGLLLGAGAAVAASTTFNGAEEFVWG